VQGKSPPNNEISFIHYIEDSKELKTFKLFQLLLHEKSNK